MRRLNELLALLGPAGVAGLGVLVFSAAFYFFTLAPLERELDAQAERQRARTMAPAPSASDGAEDLRRFYALFPPTEQLTGELDRLYALARRANVELQQGEYRMEAKSAGPAAYRISLPVRGAYPRIREFVDATLAEMPIASLDGLRVERRKAGDPVLEAQLRLTLYFRPQEGL